MGGGACGGAVDLAEPAWARSIVGWPYELAVHDGVEGCDLRRFLNDPAVEEIWIY